MSRLGYKPIAILVAVFLLGGAAGGAITWAMAVRDLEATINDPPVKARAKFRLEAMRRHLDLSDEQVAKLEVIFEEAGRDKDAAVSDCKPRLDEVREQIRAKVDAVLTPDQREKHEAFRQRKRDRFKSRPSGSADP